MKTQTKKGFKFLLFGILCLFMGCKNQPSEPQFRNVLVIVGDDHASTVVGCYGNEIIRTPNLDRLASNGIKFTNAYSNSPICSASRQSVLTGKYPHSTGVNLLFTPFNDDQNKTIAETLQENGFSTAIIGKNHFNTWIYSAFWNQWPDYGFDTIIEGGQYKDYLKNNPATPIPDSIKTRANVEHAQDIAWQKNASYLPVPYFDKDAEGSFFARTANQFMEDHKEGRFFVWLAFHEPHAPFAFPVEYSNAYNPDSLILPKGSPEDDRWIPEIFRNLTDQERRGIIASYYSSVEYMDHNIGKVLDYLEESGLDKNTLVVYFGDQGYLLNDHKRFEKHTFWAESVKAPLIIYGKGLTEGGKAFESPVEFADIAPTILTALGIPLEKQFTGEELISKIEGNDTLNREFVFSEYLQDNKAMVANQKWKYIFSTGKRDLGLGYTTGFGPSGVIHRLYDLENDPGETTNLAYHQEYSDVLKRLQQAMLDKFMRTHPMAQYCPSGLNTIGKLIWFCEPNDIGAEPQVELERIFDYEPDKQD